MTQRHPRRHEHDDDGRLPWSDPEGEELIAFPTDTRRAHREERRPRRGARRFAVLLVALGLIVGAGYFGVTALKGLFNGSHEADDYAGPGADSVSFTVNDGDTGRSIATNLEKAGIVKTPRAFVDECTADPRCAGIQPGDYALKTQMRSVDVLAVLVDPKNRQNPTVTVREGLWASEIFEQLARATSHPVSDYEAAAKDKDVIALLPPSAMGNVEGFLFPATYEFAAKDSASTQLKAMIAKSVKVLTDLKVDPATAQRLIIIASIVEAEARLDEDRTKVARTIENRLAQPMRLQLDSTVSYGVKNRSITTTDAERADPNLWNTYVHDGLPVGPIANPGEASIRAAAAPAAGPWLYFVAVNPDTGETKFAVTQPEHDANVAQFRTWCNQPENKGKC
ncbi:MAG: endolytic transglycosylase MltG [Actinomycetales bacterium]|nr:endolytic transglycosylase MltG [Actinomycetales bacterium]